MVDCSGDDFVGPRRYYIVRSRNVRIGATTGLRSILP